jgi:hypothetical protein
MVFDGMAAEIPQNQAERETALIFVVPRPDYDILFLARCAGNRNRRRNFLALQPLAACAASIRIIVTKVEQSASMYVIERTSK